MKHLAFPTIMIGIIILLFAYSYLQDVFDPAGLGNRAATHEKIYTLSLGCAFFKNDFGQCPPSRWADEPERYKSTGGAGLLAYYLLAAGAAAGRDADEPPPWPPTGSSAGPYGPYFVPKGSAQSAGRPGPIVDTFRPHKPILYFRANGDGREPLFDVTDNPVDPTGKTGFASQEQFEMLVKHKSEGGSMEWRGKEMLLISAGRDGLYGYVVKDEQTGDLRPARPEEMVEATCDDVTNFSY